MTASELADKVDDPELATCLRDAEAGAYLPGATSPADLRETLLQALTRLGLAIFALGLVLLSTTAQAEVTDNPFAAYDDGHFAEAAAAFSARLNPTRPDPVLLYNLGNCRYQQGDLTGALVCFEQARRLAPRDSDIRENLNHVRRRLMLPEVGRGNNPLTLAADLRDHFRPDEWLLLAAAAWAAAGLFLALRRRLPAHGLLTALVGTGLVAVIALTAATSQRNQTYSPEAAIILQRGAPVRVLPSETAREAEYRLYPGEPVRIVETRDDGWRRIRGEGGEGWIHADAVAPLWHPDRLELPTEKTP
jgi:tetratricopeptide (TPR) repeat protein